MGQLGNMSMNMNMGLESKHSSLGHLTRTECRYKVCSSSRSTAATAMRGTIQVLLGYQLVIQPSSWALAR